MGVYGDYCRNLKREMTHTSLVTDASAPFKKCIGEQSTEEEEQTISLFDNTDDIEALKSKMKLKLAEEVNDVGIDTVNETVTMASVLYKSLAGHELSISLPNLAESSSQNDNLKNGVNEKQTRSSFTDIYDSNGEKLIAKLEGTCKGSLSNLAPNNVSIRKLSLEDCPSCHVAENQIISAAGKHFNAKTLQQHIQNLMPQDLMINVAQNNNRLSAVLENMPLIYIPGTKQLISVGNKSKTSSPTCHVTQNTSELQENHQSNGLASGDTLCQTDSFQEQESSTDSNISHQFSDPTASSTSCENSFNSSVLSLGTDLTSDRHRNLSNADSECNSGVTALSQESDTSSRTDGTVVHIGDDNTNTQGASSRNEDFDEESINEFTKIDLNRESPKNTHSNIGVGNSVSAGDGSSFSSISSISTGTDFSNSANSFSEESTDICRHVALETDEAGFMEVNLHSRNTYERSRKSSQDSGIEEKQYHGAKPKRKSIGLSGFFSRNLFSRKPKEPCDQTFQGSAPGWKLFGKVPPKQTTQKDPNKISQEYHAKCKAQQQSVCTKGKKTQDVEVSSTTALILEQRPMGLPSKPQEEAQRHQAEYEAMVEAAKKREIKEAKTKKKHMQQQIRQEEALSAALKIWNNEILNNWETMRNSAKARTLWWNSVPPSVRGKVWQLAIGNELNLTPELYEICLNRAKERLKLSGCMGDTDSISSFTSDVSVSREASVELIKLDVSRTFPQLCIFQKGGPYHELLQGLLGAYACYRPDVGYVQGMSFIAAVLLLNMDVADAFICFANLLNRPCQIAFFRLDENLMKSYFCTYEEFFEENLPELFNHFKTQQLTPDLYIIDWMFTLYAKSLPLDVASRVWDVFSRDGEEFLFRTALGILKLFEDVLLNMDFIHLAQFLTRLPENLSGEELFKCIEKIQMSIDKRRFNQVLAAHSQPKDS